MVRVLAFFDTQFHGGDAGWRRLREARPVSRQHFALNYPSSLGAYDLADPRQTAPVVAMARLAGIDGFVIDIHRTAAGYRHDAALLAPFCQDGFGLAFRLRGGDPVEAAALADSLKNVPACLLGGRIPLIVKHPGGWSAAVVSAVREAAVRAGLPGLYLIANRAEDHEGLMAAGFDSLTDPAPDEWQSCPPTNRASGLDQLEVLAGLKDSVTYLDRFFPYLLFTVSRMIRRETRGKSLPRVFAAFHNWLDFPDGGATHLVSNDQAVDPHLFGLFVENAMLFAHNHFPADERVVFLQSWNGWFDGSQIEPSLLDGDIVYNAARAAIDRARYMIRTRGESPEGIGAALQERIALLCEAARNL